MSWVSEELRELDLGDVRLDLRLMEMIERLAEQCERSVPQAFGSWAEVKGAYRLWENPRVEWQAILAPHREQVARRAAEHPVVLAIQDTTEINLTSRPATKGVGYLGASYCRGLLLHTCLAVTPSGLVLGVLDQQIWARPTSKLGKSKQRSKLPTAVKESQRWLTGLTACDGVLADHPQVVVVGDRESDFYDFFVAQRETHVELLVRVGHESRKVEQLDTTIKQALAAAPVQGEMLIHVPRSGGRKARPARLSVRFLSLACRPPHPRCRNPQLPRVPLQWILVEETSPVPQGKPIRWLLATTLPVTKLEEAVRCVEYYARRWTIERFHFTLKSGCQVEQRQLETRENLERMIATMSIVAWRVMWLVSAARQQPDEPCTVILCEPEWQTLHAVTHRKKPRPLPAQPPTLREAVRMIAALGGFLGRKGDGEPGLKAVWQGLARLSDMTTGWLTHHPPPGAGDSTNNESYG
jgi:Transposase DNA-binding/Transposase Tn5 dimerisation domain